MRYISFLLSSILFLLGSSAAMAQDFSQSLRGTIIDQQTQMTLPGVIVEIKDNTSLQVLGVGLSDDQGEFLIEDLPLGKVQVIARIAFYEPMIIEDIDLSSAKQWALDIALKASSIDIEEVEIVANPLRGQVMNQMASVSGLSITPEQTRQMAASWDDPMRVLTAFPGIVQPGSGFNDFSIRGNSGANMLYLLEGVPIHNPNHFSLLGNSGGFVTQFSTELLSNSDFFSSAFPAEYGNVVNGVFDLRFRNGNNQRREHTFKASVFGLDFATEGPFSRDGNASYIFNYRYSTLGLLASIIDVGGVRPGYQDLSFNVTIPLKDNALIKIFGVGGIGNLLIQADQDSTSWTEDSRRIERNWGSTSGSMGLAYYKPLKNEAYLHSALSYSNGHYFDNSRFITDELDWYDTQISALKENRINWVIDINKRWKEKYFNTTGIMLSTIGHDYEGALYDQRISDLDTIAFTEGRSNVIQLYSQSKISLNTAWTLQAGFNTFYMDTANKLAFDPRVTLDYKTSHSAKISFAYGHHTRMERMPFYFVSEEVAGSEQRLNENINYLKAHHFVSSYTRMINANLKFGLELYYQYLYDVPSAGSYSVLNDYQTLPALALNNDGFGRNYGLEWSLQRFAKKDFYYLLSFSIFDSKFKTDEGIWRNTQFDQKYAYSILVGKDFKQKQKKGKLRNFGISAHWRHTGGTYYNPVDLEASSLYGSTRFDLSDPFTLQNNPLYNLDVKFSRRVSSENYDAEFSLSFKNLYSSRAIIDRSYDPRTNELRETEDYGVIPNIAYKINF